jgi:membrane protein DedA with SNARE-associated domain
MPNHYLSEKGEGDFMLMKEVIPSLLLILMGSIDCLTTVVGVLYSGAKELNPFMAGIVRTNIGAFLAVKIAATVLIAFTYILANKALIKTQNKGSKSFKYSYKVLIVGYVGIMVFMIIVVANNLLILLA